MAGKTLFEKVWDRNCVSVEAEDRPAILHVGLHLVHEVTSPQAFTEIEERGLTVRRPDLTLATMDHSTPTKAPDAEGNRPYATDQAKVQVETLVENCGKHGIELLDYNDDRRGIVHMVGPELGRTQPGIVIVCGDSHTSTHGAFGAIAFGIGTTEVGHVLATQTLFQRRPKTLRVHFDGPAPVGVAAKDMALAMIRALTAAGGTGYALEFTGPAVEALDMEGRMTLCNMSIECGARCGMVAPDQVTIDYVRGRPGAPKDFDAAAAEWLALRSDVDAVYDKEIVIDAASMTPMVTFGVAPDAAGAANGNVPAEGGAPQDALDYMQLARGTDFSSVKVDRVFVGSCTNGRLSDLRAAAAILRGRKVAEGVKMLVVPGSEAVKKAAEDEGLDQVFLAAGAEWRLPGCSMCIGMNGDRGEPGDLVVSTSNRNFKGRQGTDVRTVLASPATAAASAVAGVITDPRIYLEETAA